MNTTESPYYNNPRREMQQFIPQNRGRALEIGCASGGFLFALEDCSEKWGIEPSDAALVAERRLTKVLKGQFDAVKHELPKGYFDVVICNDVIEHMIDHLAFFRDIREFIAPGGMLVGSIPNVRFYDNLFKMLLGRDWLYTDEGVLDRTHLAFFTEKSLRRTIEEAGFVVANLKGLEIDHLVDDSRRSRRYRFLARMLSRITLGYFYDIRYLRFAFQAIPKA